MKLDIKVDTRAATRHLDEVARKQIPFATARALTAVAKLAVGDLKAGMQSAFHRPSNFTLNAFYAKPATRQSPTAYVASRDYAPKGRPAIKYLWPQIAGGARTMKGFEKLLGPQSGQQFIVPATGRIVSRGQIVQILSQLNAMRDPSQNVSAKTSARLRRQGKTAAVTGHRSQYFIGHEKGDVNGRPIGIFRVVSRGKVERVMTFLPHAPIYSVRLPVEKIVTANAARNWDREFRKALAAALASSRR